MEGSIYACVPRETLREIVEALAISTDLPVQALNADGTVAEKAGDRPDFCRYYEDFICRRQGRSCDNAYITAGKRACELGESYIFSCYSDLNLIVFPLVNKNALFGSVLIGPFVMDDPDSLLLLDIVKKNNLKPDEFIKLYDSLKNVRIISPAKVTHLSRLLYHLFSSAITDNRRQFIINQEKLYQQSRINESIQKYKSSGLTARPNSTYPYDKEKQLLTRVRTGNIQDAKAILNDLLGYTLFAEGNNLQNIRPRALELASLLSRAAIEGGAPTDSTLKINNEFLKHLQSDMSIDDLCYHLQEITEAFTESMFGQTKEKSSETMKKAIRYIALNFASDISLVKVADYVGLNPSYFSTYFKQMCGSSFKEYLNMVRIEEAKRLLANTDYAILDIAIAIGFENQSYFSKVFKKFTGLTPKQYR